MRDSILSLTGGAEDFLLRVDGHDQPVFALRDNITWNGYRVSYYQITNYRRDQNGRTGELPRIYNRQDWANIAKDTKPSYDNVKFENWDSAIPAWELKANDLRPVTNANSTQEQPGPDLKRVASPPTVD